MFYEFYFRDFGTRVLPMWLNSLLNEERGNHFWASYTHSASFQMTTFQMVAIRQTEYLLICHEEAKTYA